MPRCSPSSPGLSRVPPSDAVCSSSGAHLDLVGASGQQRRRDGCMYEAAVAQAAQESNEGGNERDKGVTPRARRLALGRSPRISLVSSTRSGGGAGPPTGSWQKLKDDPPNPHRNSSGQRLNQRGIQSHGYRAEPCGVMWLDESAILGILIG
ncbi:hypothetical protein NHX12_029648 [Muraenolepis orangiensis]|uniref:Uncharacterized protein n=1 Tax=Muraenolepis orangiensis TaxID=630683 RepID=A0A9Q0IM00_9TELE|nr:hypothetical protein NHX12_029648 [Muraenolepis orangiensis]